MDYPNRNTNLPLDFEDMRPPHYDQDYAVDISTKMQIPERINPFPSFNSQFSDLSHSWQEVNSNPMTVPQRIVVAGDDTNSKSTMKLNFDDEFMAVSQHDQYVGLKTPPRTLTMEQTYASFAEDEIQQSIDDENDEEVKTTMMKSSKMLPNGYVRVTPPTKRSNINTPFGTPGDGLFLNDPNVDDVTNLRRQINKLHVHVSRLEDDNLRRTQRELIFYPIIFGYFMLRFAKWVFRSN